MNLCLSNKTYLGKQRFLMSNIINDCKQATLFDTRDVQQMRSNNERHILFVTIVHILTYIT